MEYPLVCIQDAVATLDKNSLLESVLDAEADTLLKEVKVVKGRLEAKQRLVHRACNELVFLNRSVVQQLNDVRRQLAIYKGVGFNPVDTRDPQEVEEEFREMKSQRNRQEELERNREKLRRRKASEKAKYWFRKLQAMCHPDRTTDKNLHAYLPIIQMHAEDEDLLESVYESLEEYIRAKKSKSKAFFDKSKARINNLRGTLNELTNKEVSLENSSDWQLVTLMKQGKVADASALFTQRIKEQIALAESEIDEVVSSSKRTAKKTTSSFYSFIMENL